MDDLDEHLESLGYGEPHQTLINALRTTRVYGHSKPEKVGKGARNRNAEVKQRIATSRSVNRAKRKLANQLHHLRSNHVGVL
jgi:hypothetical protein